MNWQGNGEGEGEGEGREGERREGCRNLSPPLQPFLGKSTTSQTRVVTLFRAEDDNVTYITKFIRGPYLLKCFWAQSMIFSLYLIYSMCAYLQILLKTNLNKNQYQYFLS